MTFCFFGSWLCQSVNGWRAYNHQQLEHKESTITWGEYWGNADFWDRSLQNWQSEFLAIGSHGRLHDLPPPTRLAGVEARRCSTRRNRNFELAALPTPLH